uniref:Rho GTPase-activating protein 44 n=1 Tax=Accipiter nisus TaxID=211598 RepID=A0A8B9N2X7_9AVES
KKLTACLQGQQGVDADKRSKKLPLTTLAQCLMEGSAVLGDDSLLGKMLRLCGEAEDKLAQELIHFELQVERDVIEPLFVLAEVEIPNIQKQRKHLAKLVLDMDSSRTRWQQSAKSSGLASNLQPSGAKADALREEMEEAANRVEICRDQLSADMYNFVAKEVDYANYFQTLIEVQAEYHRKSLALLQNVLPQIKAQQEAWMEKPSFGKPLEEHLAVSGREIAFPVEACVTMLLECGMQEEGLFRVAPSASKLKKLKAALDCCVVDVQEYSADPHAIAGALKSYLRELPEPLMTFELYEEWIQASNIPEQEKRLQALWNACEKLPKANYNNIRYLIKFLAKLTEYQDTNKMTPSNVAIVLGPNLLWDAGEGGEGGIIEPLIQHADWFFPGGRLWPTAMVGWDGLCGTSRPALGNGVLSSHIYFAGLLPLPWLGPGQGSSGRNLARLITAVTCWRCEWGGLWCGTGAVPRRGQVPGCPQSVWALLRGKAPHSQPVHASPPVPPHRDRSQSGRLQKTPPGLSPSPQNVPRALPISKNHPELSPSQCSLVPAVPLLPPLSKPLTSQLLF